MIDLLGPETAAGSEVNLDEHADDLLCGPGRTDEGEHVRALGLLRIADPAGAGRSKHGKRTTAAKALNKFTLTLNQRECTSDSSIENNINTDRVEERCKLPHGLLAGQGVLGGD